MPQYVIRRNKKDTHVVFGKAARALPSEAIGSIKAQMSSSGNANNLDIIQTDISEEEGTDYLILYDIPFGDFRTRSWNTNKTSLSSRVSYGSTTAAIVGINSVVEFQTSDLSSGGGGAGNPVTSGAVTGAGNTTLRLTLNDSSNVDIDVTNLRTTTSIGSSTDYFYLNNGAQLSSNTHSHAAGVAFWNQKLKRGEELVFSTPGNDTHVGIWNGGNGVTGEANVTNKSNWQIKWEYNHSNVDWEAANTSTGPTGVEFNRDIVANNGTYAIRYDYDTEKLQLWQISTAFDWLLSSSASGIGTTESYVYFASGDGTGGYSLPSVSEVRASEWTLQSYVNAPAGPTIHSGAKDDDIWKSTRSLRPGLKLKTTIGSDVKLHHWGVGYGGTTGMGNGPQNPYGNATGSWRASNSQEIRAEENSTFNNSYTAAVDTSQNLTLGLAGRNISWRYNSNNSWDLFDEDTDEVILTGDTNLNGSDMYPYLFPASNINTHATQIPQWEWDWNDKQWFLEYRDWESGHNTDVALTLRNNAMPMKTAAQSLEQSSGFYTITNPRINITWGEKLRPGQELIWTQLTINNNGATKNNFIVGVMNSNYNGYTAGIRFFRAGAVKEQADQDAGFTLAAGIGTATQTAGASMRMQYQYGTNKLVCYKVESGVRTKLGESTSALDGNPVFISMGGDSSRMPTSTTGVEVYGWEIAHEPPNYYNPWKNWRIGSFPENVTGKVGIHTNGGVLNWAADQVWRHKDGLAPGYKMHWLTPSTHPNGQIGVWSTTNASSGLTNLENNDTHWDWSWQHNTSEEIDGVKGWSFNTSNSNYSATKWTDPNPGSTKISLRYHSNNSMDLYDESNSEVIITKNVNNDGNPIYISWTVGGNTVTQAQMQDDFFGGGDVGIALTTATV